MKLAHRVLFACLLATVLLVLYFIRTDSSHSAASIIQSFSYKLQPHSKPVSPPGPVAGVAAVDHGKQELIKQENREKDLKAEAELLSNALGVESDAIAKELSRARRPASDVESTWVGDKTTEKPKKDDDEPITKAVIVGALPHEDASWVVTDLPEWENAIYHIPLNTTLQNPAISTPDKLFTPINKGREALVYLTYIVDNYAHLPRIMAFIHPHKDGYPIAWHTDTEKYSNVVALKTASTDYIIEFGYTNLRCNPNPGCPGWIEPRLARTDREPEPHIAQAWHELFPNEEVPEKIGAPCCAQFAVTREQVLKRSLSDYKRFRDWVLNTRLIDENSGRVMEYLWHIIFSKPAVECPNMRDCYCRMYGRRCSRFAMGHRNHPG